MNWDQPGGSSMATQRKAAKKAGKKKTAQKKTKKVGKKKVSRQASKAGTSVIRTPQKN